MFDKDLSFSPSNIRNGIRPNIDVNKDILAYHMKKDKRYSITYDCGFEKLIAIRILAKRIQNSAI